MTQEDIDLFFPSLAKHKGCLRGLSREELRWARGNTSEVATLLIRAIKNRVSCDHASRRFTVDYRLSIEDMKKALKAIENYGFIEQEINGENFPIVGSGLVTYEPKLLYYNHRVASSEILRDINTIDQAHTWRQGKIEHLLSFGAAFPSAQLDYPIVAPGALLGEGLNCRAAYLYKCGEARELGLYLWGVPFRAGYAFLAVREVSRIE